MDRGAVRAPIEATDVIALVKEYMGSELLSQPPLLVLSAGRAPLAPMVPSQKLHGLKRTKWVEFKSVVETPSDNHTIPARNIS